MTKEAAAAKLGELAEIYGYLDLSEVKSVLTQLGVSDAKIQEEVIESAQLKPHTQNGTVIGYWAAE